jgi:hypothetical protein
MYATNGLYVFTKERVGAAVWLVDKHTDHECIVVSTINHGQQEWLPNSALLCCKCGPLGLTKTRLECSLASDLCDHHKHETVKRLL